MTTTYTTDKNDIALDVKSESPADRKESVVAGTIMAHSHDADVALMAMAGLGADMEIDEETNKRLLRKIDWNLMPVSCALGG